ncbi:hypothetical protein BDW_08660 [Bdellovibrio bacteriovorus W]|nr:hypothetical protein BDW_08660 [Bdellovibrio bacteriovorus W]
MSHRDYPGPINPAAKEALEFLVTPDNPHLYQDLIRSYLKISDELAESLQKSHVPDTYRKIAHTWRSSSLSLGAEDLAALCKDLESNPENSDLIPLILIEYAKVKTALIDSGNLSTV